MSEDLEFDRSAVVTVQGGGLYVFSLLGQLHTVVDRHKITPLAIAGNSGGAILAALYWAGYSPLEIRTLFIELVTNNKLAELFGPFNVDNVECTPGMASELLKELRATGREAAKLRNFWQRWKAPFLLKKVWRLYRKINPLVDKRGLFQGQGLEQWIDDRIANSPLVSPYRDTLQSQDRPITFGTIRRLMQEHQDDCYLSPLFLTATNISTGQLQVFNSVDDAYLNIPVALAVRASAGFPGVFRPVWIGQGPLQGWYVDGGLVTNFPAWVFADAIRIELAKSAVYQGLASRPWIHIGLQLHGENPGQGERAQTAAQFGLSLANLMAGAARNQLEDRLEANIPRSVTVQQPFAESGGPSHLVALNEMTEDKIRAMVQRGEEFAEQTLSRLSFTLPPATEVQPLLEDLIAQATTILGQDSNKGVKLRANVFLVRRDELVLSYAVNMANDPDREMAFHFTSGLTGFCFGLRRPLICNLEQVGELRKQDPEGTKRLFGMTDTKQAKIREDRTWLASVPIFDPLALRAIVRSPSSETNPPTPGRYYEALPGNIDGPVLGVLNLDGALSYSELRISTDTAMQWQDSRIRAIIGVTQAIALRVGAVFSEHFGVMRE